jgi:molecular chaperone GrpE
VSKKDQKAFTGPDAQKLQPEASAEVPAEGNDSESAEARALVERIQRLQAEFENYKKRVSREASEREDRVVDQFLLGILPLYDGFRLAFENYNRDQDTEALVSGVERIFAQFEEILKGKAVSRIEAIGEPFDPAFHEALLSLASEQEKNTVIEEFSPGYVRNGRTLRPSKVAVSQGPSQAKEEVE